MIEGGIYSVDNGDGTFGIVKILKMDPEVVHLCIFADGYRKRPTKVSGKSLSVEEAQIGHIPVDKNDFSKWNPALLLKTKVLDEELMGYEIWKESNGGTFGPA